MCYILKLHLLKSSSYCIDSLKKNFTILHILFLRSYLSWKLTSQKNSIVRTVNNNNFFKLHACSYIDNFKS